MTTQLQPSPPAPSVASASPLGGEPLEDFLEGLDEDRWAEWVSGEVMEMSPASLEHQDLVRFLVTVLGLYVEEKGLGRLIPAPFPVALREQERVREPDLIFLAREHLERLGETRLEGAPDLAVEIVSPESIGRDRGEKFVEYEAAGVVEYWLIDPQRQQAEIYLLGEDGRYRPQAADAEGALPSRVLPGFRLVPAWLWQKPLPRLLELLPHLGLTLPGAAGG